MSADERGDFLHRRLLRPRPFVHEVAAVFWVMGVVLVLENLPVTYTRSALLGAYVRFAVAVLVLFVGIVAVVRMRARWLRTESSLSLVETAVLALRVLAVLTVPLAAHFLLKSFIYLINPRVFDAQLARLDTILHLGVDPGSVIPVLLHHPTLLHAFDVLYSALYFPLLVLYTALLLALLPLRRTLVFGAAFLYVWILGGIVYVALPSWGPVFVSPDTYQDVLLHMPFTVSVQRVLFQEISTLVTDPLGPRTVIYGCVAAFPSLHVAMIALFTLASKALSRRWFQWNLVLLALMIVGSVLTGYHYLLDAWGGLAVVAAAWWLADRSIPCDAQNDATGASLTSRGPQGKKGAPFGASCSAVAQW